MSHLGEYVQNRVQNRLFHWLNSVTLSLDFSISLEFPDDLVTHFQLCFVYRASSVLSGQVEQELFWKYHSFAWNVNVIGFDLTLQKVSESWCECF